MFQQLIIGLKLQKIAVTLRNFALKVLLSPINTEIGIWAYMLYLIVKSKMTRISQQNKKTRKKARKMKLGEESEEHKKKANFALMFNQVKAMQDAFIFFVLVLSTGAKGHVCM